jgi:Ig-like domain-containing protein
VADVTVPDGTLVIPGDTVEKVWQLTNCGNTSWDGYQAVQVEGNYGPAVIDVPRTSPGATVDLSVELQIPDIPGVQRAVYQLQAPAGSFGSQFFAEVAIPDCNVTEEESAAHITLSRSALGGEWCPIPVPKQAQFMYAVHDARFANSSEYSTPRQARFWVMVAPNSERVLNPMMVLADMVLGQPTGGPGSAFEVVHVGDGPAVKFVRVTPDGGSGQVYYSFFVDKVNAFVTVSGAAGEELSDVDEQAYRFAKLQEQLLRNEAQALIVR